MSFFRYIIIFYFKIIILLLSLIILLYLFIAKEKAYYYCDDICITIIQHNAGRDTFFRVYDGILLSRYAYLIYSYAEYPNETYIYIKNKKIDGKIIVENFTMPVKYKGKLNNANFYLSSYESSEIKFTELKYLYLFF
ncbi:hypothetical protein LU293_03430 [Moraxella nasovis]|uniref:hypothetical protein n=1 Tax=Moraxella nasovis TaxID=2904121 RepID=UPI001F60506C|nr:hypothetical protein [Moraxella nasovis]UNU73961.1 hypothetical protein LU293_03430 [Moraxella nasovis]